MAASSFPFQSKYCWDHEQMRNPSLLVLVQVEGGSESGPKFVKLFFFLGRGLLASLPDFPCSNNTDKPQSEEIITRKYE